MIIEKFFFFSQQCHNFKLDNYICIPSYSTQIITLLNFVQIPSTFFFFFNNYNFVYSEYFGPNLPRVDIVFQKQSVMFVFNVLQENKIINTGGVQLVFGEQLIIKIFRKLSITVNYVNFV